MATEFSFDVISKVDVTEVKNAIDQTEKELASRYDFRETKSTLELDDNTVKLMSDDEFHLTTLIDILRSKMAKPWNTARSRPAHAARRGRPSRSSRAFPPTRPRNWSS